MKICIIPLTNIEQSGLHDFMHRFREKALPRPVSLDFVFGHIKICFGFSCACPLILPNHHSTIASSLASLVEGYTMLFLEGGRGN